MRGIAPWCTLSRRPNAKPPGGETFRRGNQGRVKMNTLTEQVERWNEIMAAHSKRLAAYIDIILTFSLPFHCEAKDDPGLYAKVCKEFDHVTSDTLAAMADAIKEIQVIMRDTHGMPRS